LASGFTRKLLSLILVVAGVVVAQTPPPPKDIPAIAKAVNGAIVTIIMLFNDKPIAEGTGFLVSPDGLTVTNYHVIETGNLAIVKFPNGTILPVDGVLAANKVRDLAIIKIHGKTFRTLTLGNSDRVQVGEGVVAIGNPLSLESTVSNGIVSGVRKVERLGGKFLQTTAPISPGSSGGPLFNMAGEVVGINTLYLEGGENLNFAIPINDAKLLLLNQSAKLQNLPNEAAKESVREAQVAPTDKPNDPPSPSTKIIAARGTALDQLWEGMKYCFQNPVDSVQLPDGAVSSCREVNATREAQVTKCAKGPEDETGVCGAFLQNNKGLAKNAGGQDDRWFSDLFGGEFQIKAEKGLIRIVTIRPPNEDVLHVYHVSPANFSHDIVLDVKADGIDLGGLLDSYVECKKNGKRMAQRKATLQLHAASDSKFVGLFGVIDSGCSVTLTPITFASK